MDLVRTRKMKSLPEEQCDDHTRERGAESQLVRGLAAPNSRVELPCLVDLATCGEVYYITWTKQVVSAAGDAPTWTRVYLYTGANDSAPHKPIGDLLQRATFTMPTSGASDPSDFLPTPPPPRAPVAKLVIEEPRLQDEALYKCDVTYVKGKCPSISLVRLQMMALPERAQIFTLPNELAGESPLKGEASAPGQVIGPLNELDQLQLACLIRGGRPAPKAAFWRKIDPTGRTINLPLASQQHTVIAGGGENGNPTTNGNNNNKLRQSPADELAALKVTLNHTLTSDDLGAKFECHVEHEALDAMRPMARVISTKPPLAPGPDAMLDLHPAASSSINRHDDGGDSSSSSSLDEDGEMQAGAESMALAAHVLPSLDSHVIVDLNVGVSSLDLFLTKHTAGSQHQQSQAGQRNASEPLHEGDLIELECVAYNSKPAANITWLNGQDAIGASDQTGGAATTARSVKQPAMQTEHRALRQRRLLQRNQVQLNPDGLTYNTHSFLSIKLSRHEHRAQISCQAQNGARSASRQQPLVKSIELQVQHAPIVLMEPAAGIVVNEFATPPVIPDTSNQRQLETQQQQQVQIYCIYSANPLQLAPNSVRWFKDGQPLDVHKSQAGRLVESLTPSTGYPVLTIRQPNRADAGRYDCQLANSLGTSERLAPSEACKLEVNFRPSVHLRLLKETTTAAAAGQVEFDAERELVLPGDELVLACQVLEAQPNKITSYHWFARPLSSPAGDANGSNQRQWPRPPATSRPLAVTEGPRYRLPAMRANFTPTSYACLASNAIGQSEPSEPIDLQLSHTPGPSRVRPIADALLRKIILSSGGKAPAAHPVSAGGAVIDPTATAGPKEENIDMEKPMSAGRELLLECLTQDLGRPRANIWLWFKDGQTIESSSRHQQEEQQPSRLQQDEVERIDSTAGSNNNNNLESKSDFILKDNPISDRLHDLSPANPVAADQPPQVFGNDNVEQQQQRAAVGHRQHTSPRLLGSGRYLFIPSIQLAHRGNYSCVAVNRLGTGSSFAPTATHLADRSGNGRDSYQLKVALAPSFIQPLPTRTYWAETTAASSSSSANDNNNNDVANPSQSNGNEQLELVCRVQCEPICHIEWLRNNEPIDMLKRNDSSDNNNGHTSGNNYVSYHARHTIMDENEAANMFRSIESKLVLSFHGLAGGEQQRMDTSSKRVLIDRDKLLERRHFLNNSNFTCRSSANSMGGPVKSTTIFSVQYPPENVLISVPSDKLNLVEGSNGPLLSCEASGLPQVQYRWLLLRSGNNIITSSDLVAARYNTRHFGSGPAAGTGQVQSGIANNNKQDSAGDGSGGQRPRTPRAGSQHNDAASTVLQQLLTAEASSAQPAAQRFVELTGLSGGEQVGSSTMISTLDLSNISIDRKQAGHYICEASNELGETRQSVYVNVLYKPTCTTLHMHSLDSTGSLLAQETQDTRHRDHHSAGQNEELPVTKPFGASAQDEYALVRESSGDFIDLRRVLVMSPMLNRLTSAGLSTDQQQQQLEGDKLSFSGSIFGAILDASRSRGVKLSSPLNDGVALHHDDLSNSISSASIEMDSGDASSDSWAKFNSILLKFLNNYSRQIRQEEDRRARSAASASRRTQQTRRSSSSSSSSSSANTNSFGTIDESAIVNAGTGEATEKQLAPPGSDRQQTSHLLTFACMAQEGNPMQNLTFDWYFGAMRLPHVNQTSASDHNNNVDGNYYLPTSSGPSDEQRPLLIYGNKNSTLTVLMTRRLDTKTMLNPFQMSLLTIKVISSNADLNSNGAQQLDGTNSTSEELLMRAPVIKSRYQSLYSQPKAGDSAQLARQQRNNNIQFGQEHAQANDEIDLDAFNWQHRLGALLSCSVANSIGPSEPSYVRVNVAERLGKSGIAADVASNSLYEFAKWRMPSLAQKSLLIISLLIGCSLIVFATFALLIGPHLRALHFLHKSQQCCASGGASSGSGSSKTTTDETGTNTGQSTSSQKSSVLGLLGNGGDLSFPSSSDDDTSARLNQLDSGLIVANGGIGQMAVAHQHQNTNLGLQRRGMLVESQQHKSIDDSVNYDQPRNIMTTNTHQARLIYQPDGGNFDATGLNSTYVNYQFHDDNANSEQLMGTRHRKSSTSSTSSKILASLRLNPFSRAKIQDRLSDLPSITGRLTSLHNRNVSSSETATTGVSIDANSGANLRGYQNFGNMPANLRHSYAGGRRAPLASHYAQGPPLMHRDFYTQDEATSSRLMQLNSQALRVNRSSTLMSAHHQRRPPLNAMDEFMRVRGLDTTTTNTTGFDELDDEDTLATTYGSQSIRNQSSTLYSLRNDLAAQHQRNNIKPPVFPRSNTHQQSYATSTMYKRPPPPPIAARTLQQQQQQLHYHHQGQSGSTVNNFAAPMYPISSAPYGESFIMQGQQQPMSMNPFAGYNQHIAYANTFDTRNPYDNYEDQPVEHIYDVNAYATPEQTPLRSGNNDSNKLASTANQEGTNKSERPRVSQLIQTFDSKLPDQSPC